MEATDELINQRAAELCELHHSILNDANTHIKREAAWKLFDKSFMVFLHTFYLHGSVKKGNDYGSYFIVWRRREV